MPKKSELSDLKRKLEEYKTIICNSNYQKNIKKQLQPPLRNRHKRMVKPGLKQPFKAIADGAKKITWKQEQKQFNRWV